MLLLHAGIRFVGDRNRRGEGLPLTRTLTYALSSRVNVCARVSTPNNVKCHLLPSIDILTSGSLTQEERQLIKYHPSAHLEAEPPNRKWRVHEVAAGYRGMHVVLIYL